MILSIIGIFDQANLEKQCVTLSVKEDGNLKEYAIVDSTYLNGTPSNLHRHFYSFPDWEVKKGDIISLYTTEGKNISYKRKFKDVPFTAHHLYWNLEISVWNAKDTAYLLQIADKSNSHYVSK
jgi:hypothetical protein